MKFLVYLCAVVLIFVTPLFSQIGRLEVVNVHSPSIEGNLLGDTPNIAVSIYLPAAYDANPNDRFSVIYMLHGFTESNWSFIQRYDLKAVFDDYFSVAARQPMIIVIPSAYNKYRGSFYTNSIVTGKWEDFITQELVEYIDNNYRTSQHRLSRGITGHSMGGYGAIKLAMKYPEIYSAVYSLSGDMVFEDIFMGTILGALCTAANETSWPPNWWWDVQACIAAAAAFTPNVNPHPFYCDFPVETNCTLIDSVWQIWLEHDPYSLVGTYRENLLQLSGIKFDCGDADWMIFGANQHFDTLLTVENIPHSFDPYPGNHINKIPERVRTRMLPFFSGILTDVESDYQNIPNEFTLLQNYPNPFNPITKIKYSVPQSSNVVIKVFDILGNEIETLVNEEKPIGIYEITWYAESLSGGVYFYKLQAGSFIATKKMVLLR